MYNSQGSMGWLEQVPPEVRSMIDVRFGDIRDGRFVEDACRDVEVVFHLAALIAIPYSYQAPLSFVETNVLGTLNILEGCRRSHSTRIVHTSTSEVYGTPATLPIRETHPLNAQSPYAASKVAADQLALSFHRSFGTPVTILRPFNTYGPRQSARAVTATILVQLLAGKREIKLGRLDTKRDLTYVSDVVQGFLRAGSAPLIEGKTIQLGTGRTTSISELFEMACKVTGMTARVEQDQLRVRPGPSEVLVLQSDPSSAHEYLGWSPRISLEEGLKCTAAWLQANGEYYHPDRLLA
jgi:UDP-glucose 4-epimerase